MDERSICYIFPKLKLTWPDFQLDKLLKSLEFDYQFNSTARSTAFFGNNSYQYGNIFHAPKPISSNPLVEKLFNNFCAISSHIKANSVLINYYPHKYSRLPFHSDNEREILNNSWIYTLSLGSARVMHFREANSKMQLLSVPIQHGDLIAFSRASQECFEHAIAPILETVIDPMETIGCRISLTFRYISDSTVNNGTD